MAERARSKAKKTTTKGGKTVSRGKVAKTKPGPGHNSGGVPDEVYERHLKKIETTDRAMAKAKEEYDQTKGVHQQAYKAAKADGCDIDAIKLARKLDQRDAGVVAIQYSETGRILKLMGSPLSVEMKLFDDIELPIATKASLDGKQAGAMSAPRDSNPHRQGTPEYVAWDDAYVAAQSNLSPELRAD